MKIRTRSKSTQPAPTAGIHVAIAVKALLSPRGAFLISGPKRGVLIREVGLIQIFDEIHNDFPYFTIAPITKTEQENGFVSPFSTDATSCIP